MLNFTLVIYANIKVMILIYKKNKSYFAPIVLKLNPGYLKILYLALQY